MYLDIKETGGRCPVLRLFLKSDRYAEQKAKIQTFFKRSILDTSLN